jgi:hypothetical protein
MNMNVAYMQAVAGTDGVAWQSQEGPFVTPPTAPYERSVTSAFGLEPTNGSDSDKILGIDRRIVIVGGIGLAAGVALILFLKR